MRLETHALGNTILQIMFAIIDIETTGGTAAYERITEIAIVLHDGRNVVDSYTTLLNPERSIPWGITQLTGITNEMVATAPKFYEVARKIVEMTQDTVFVAHNVTFDYHFVQEEFKRLGYDFARQRLCTVRLARKTFPGLPSYSLSNLKKHFGIEAARSHRALDDALATTTLFEHILSAHDDKGLQKFLNQGKREAKLPPTMSLDALRAIPEACGVYYFHDEKGTVIYVGKSLNIQKRLFEHFADPTPKGEKLRQGVANVSYETTGGELAALLLESAEIKRLQPRVNRAQRLRNRAAAIFTYQDQRGYQCLVIGKNTAQNAKKLQTVAEYAKLDHAKNHLMALTRQHELCYRLTHLDASERACFHYGIKQCKGACIGAEPPADYNERVGEALRHLDKRLVGSFAVIEAGRKAEEQTLVVVHEGRYMGYLHIDKYEQAFSAEDILVSLSPPHERDPDVPKIIRGYLESKKGVKVVRFGRDEG